MDTENTNDMAALGEMLTEMDTEITAEEYLDFEEDLSTCLSFDGASEANWQEKL